MSHSRTQLSPHDAADNTDEKAFTNALALFQSAAKRVPAYKDFLKKHNFDPKNICSKNDFLQLPTTSKENYFSVYGPDELSWDGDFTNADYITTSSGSSGKPFVWPRSDIQGDISGESFQHIYEGVFDLKRGSTLFIISFSFGQWLAGFEFLHGVLWTRNRGSRISVVTAGIDAVDIVAKVKAYGSYYDRLFIAGYPPYIRDILELGINSGVKWEAYDLNFIMAGEPFTEKWRDIMLEKVGKKGELCRMANVYGTSEAGNVGFETPTSILFRRYLESNPSGGVELDLNKMTCLYQYHPTARYFEVKSDDSLLLTTNADFPLIRYETRDMGGLMDRVDFSQLHDSNLLTMAKKYGIDLDKWQLPFIYLYGRKDFSVLLYAANIYTEHVKKSLEEAELSGMLSGLFTMSVTNTEEMEQQLEIEVELHEGQAPNEALERAVCTAVVDGLRKYSSEYMKLCDTVGDKVRPHITLVPYGQLNTIRGKKHKWAKKRS